VGTVGPSIKKDLKCVPVGLCHGDSSVAATFLLVAKADTTTQYQATATAWLCRDTTCYASCALLHFVLSTNANVFQAT
jgi:hypothetical protein